MSFFLDCIAEGGSLEIALIFAKSPEELIGIVGELEGSTIGLCTWGRLLGLSRLSAELMLSTSCSIASILISLQWVGDRFRVKSQHTETVCPFWIEKALKKGSRRCFSDTPYISV